MDNLIAHFQCLWCHIWLKSYYIKRINFFLSIGEILLKPLGDFKNLCNFLKVLHSLFDLIVILLFSGISWASKTVVHAHVSRLVDFIIVIRKLLSSAIRASLILHLGPLFYCDTASLPWGALFNFVLADLVRSALTTSILICIDPRFSHLSRCWVFGHTWRIWLII